MVKGGRKIGSFKQQIAKPAPLGPEYNPWYWNPNRPDIRLGPSDFRKKMKGMDERLDVTWNPITERWQIWVVDPKIQHKICQGWRFLFSTDPRELDERVMAELYARSGYKWGNLFEMWLRVEQEIERDREKAEQFRADEVKHTAGEYYDYTLIKNIGSGSKFTNHHTE